jgi:hypothetical protein
MERLLVKRGESGVSYERMKDESPDLEWGRPAGSKGVLFSLLSDLIESACLRRANDL